MSKIHKFFAQLSSFKMLQRHWYSVVLFSGKSAYCRNLRKGFAARQSMGSKHTPVTDSSIWSRLATSLHAWEDAVNVGRIAAKHQTISMNPLTNKQVPCFLLHIKHVSSLSHPDFFFFVYMCGYECVFETIHVCADMHVYVICVSMCIEVIDETWLSFPGSSPLFFLGRNFCWLGTYWVGYIGRNIAIM